MTKRNLLSSEEVANIITSVLLADKRSMTVGVSLAELDSEYRELNGTRVPFRALGYPSLLDFLESLQRKNEISLNKRDGMHVVYLRVNKKTAHVSALVSGQKDSNKRNSRGGRKRVMRSFSNEYYRPPRLDSKTLAAIVKLVKNSARGMPIHRIMKYLKDQFVRNVNEQHLIRQLQEINHEVFVKDDTVYPILRSQRTSQPISSEWSTNATNENSSSKKPEVNLQPAGCSDSENEDNFKYVSAAKKTECAQQSTSINNNQTSRMNEESKVVESPTVENANACFREDENSYLADEKDIGMLVDKKTRFRLEKLIQKHSEGIWCAELPMFYRKEYEIPLCYEGLGFDGVSDFAAHLPEIFHCVRLQDNGDFKLFNAKAPKPEDKYSERPSHLSLAAIHNIYESLYDEEEACPVTLSSLTSEKLIPNGVMRVGETTGQLFVTELFRNTDDSIDVVVVDVITPTFFWIQLLKKTSRFKTFMTELHEFYTENASKYVVPIVLLERGLNCACIYDKIWHRGIIKSVKHDNTVTVMFYDYGTVMNYQSHQIHFLHRSFSSLPAQAIPCGLYNVKPKFTDKWPQIVCQEFVSKVLDVPLVAMLGSIDADNNSMLIALTNTEGNMDFHVNDWMVSSGYAVYGKMVCIRPPNYPFRRFLECAHGTTAKTLKKTLNSEEIVRVAVNVDDPITLPSASKSTDGNLSFYHTLLKLHRKSDANSPVASSNTSSIDSESNREQQRPLTPVKSQVDKIPTSAVVTREITTIEATTNGVIASRNVDKPFVTRGKNFGTNLLKKLCEAHANRTAAMNVSSESISNEIVKSSVTSSSASIVLPDGKNVSVGRKRANETPENLKVSSTPKRNANLLKLMESKKSTPLSTSIKFNKTLVDATNSLDNNFSRDEEILPEPLLDTPLHLTTEIPERRNDASEFGAIHSTHGGHGKMEPIDWNEIRNGGRYPGNISDTSRQKLLPHINSIGEAKALPIISSEVPKVLPLTNGFSKLPPAKKAFLNFVNRSKEKQQVLPEFNANAAKDSSKPVKNMPVDLPPAGQGFLNVINSSLPSTNERDCLCVSEGNIERQTDVSPTLRMILKSANEERGDKQLRLFIPNNVAELLRDDDKTDDSMSVNSNSSSITASDKQKSDNPKEVLMETRDKSTDKYQSLGNMGFMVEQNSSDTAPATTESDYLPENDTSDYLDSSNDTSGIIIANDTKLREDILKPDSAIASYERSAARPNDDTQDTIDRVVPLESIEAAEKAIILNPEDSREKVDQENEDKPVDSVLNEFSLNSKLLTTFLKFIGTRRGSTNDSELDSDDLSIQGDTDKKYSTKLENSGKEVEKPVDERFERSPSIDDVPSSLTKNFHSSTEKLDVALSISEDQEVSKNSEVFDRAENSICSLKNTNESPSVRKIPEYIPCFDDTCVDSDSDEWDFSPGRGLPLCIDDQFQLEDVNSSEDVDGDLGYERPNNRLTLNDDSSSDESSVDESNKNKEKNVFDAANSSFPLVESSAEPKTTADISNFQGSSRPYNYSTDENQNESLQMNHEDANNNDSLRIPENNSYSILSEVQKFNISAAANAFANTSSSTSSSSFDKSNNNNYAKSLINVFKNYL